MKKMVVITCAIGLLASCAWAYPGPDSIGLYSDAEMTGAVGPLCDTVAPFSTYNLYLLISNPSGSQVSAWEANVSIDTTVGYFGDWIFDGINVGAGDNFVVGTGENPLLPNSVGNIVLMYIPMTPMADTAPITFYVGPQEGSLPFPNNPGYAEDVGVEIDLTCNTGGPTVPVFILNPTDGDCDIVGNETTSWGSVKTLYQ